MTDADFGGGVAVEATDLLVRHETAVGPVTALDHPGLLVPAGTSVAIMGPSGCGKSTLLGVLAALALPTSGRVRVGDTIVSDLSERDRVRFRRDQLGMIYQADNLLPFLTVEENIAVAPAIAGRQTDDPAELIERLGLTSLARRYPDQLSGGQRQRAAVARAVVGRPRLLLADEPTGALDEGNAEAVISLLVDARRDLGASLVLVTHDPRIAERLDRVEHLARPAPPQEVDHVA